MYCCHISRSLVKTTLRILGQQIREKKNMSSYYVDGLLSKYTAGSSLFPNAQRASCSIGPGGEDYASARTAAAIALSPSLSGVYSVNNAVYQNRPAFTGYGQGQDAHPLHCALFDQSRLFSDSCCHPEPGPLTLPPDKQYRMYPWMRASGTIPSRTFYFKAYRSMLLKTIGILTLAVSGSINFE